MRHNKRVDPLIGRAGNVAAALVIWLGFATCRILLLSCSHMASRRVAYLVFITTHQLHIMSRSHMHALLILQATVDENKAKEKFLSGQIVIPPGPRLGEQSGRSLSPLCLRAAWSAVGGPNEGAHRLNPRPSAGLLLHQRTHPSLCTHLLFLSLAIVIFISSIVGPHYCLLVSNVRRRPCA